MTSASEVKGWKAPTWHPDFGDPGVELGLLQDFCLALVGRSSEFHLTLNCFEEGYMCVLVAKPSGQATAELQMVPDQGKLRYGLFLENGDEFFFDDVLEGVQALL